MKISSRRTNQPTPTHTHQLFDQVWVPPQSLQSSAAVVAVAAAAVVAAAAAAVAVAAAVAAAEPAVGS